MKRLVSVLLVMILSLAFLTSAAFADDPLSDARGQGIYIPKDFVLSYPEGRLVTVYSTDRDNGSFGKSRPENGRQYRLTSLEYPYNAYHYGTYNGWHLIKTTDGAFYYIYASITGLAPIKVDPEDDTEPIRGAGLIDLIEGNGTVVPENFKFTDVKVGALENHSGTETYAIYKYHDPENAARTSDSYGKFYFMNTANSKTFNYDGRVTIYGHYGSFALMESATGEFFWGHDSLFVKE